ncbi:LOB domain-containing protein 22-like [Pyrus x bretschneideri]|uniref:LOB domain-containing protein 22-like n=1 Tax=Pyrus x bretschneideri TaxID=225117 RepID=UPI00202EAA27|nr:LOB domain-containing protein 22-like [Pyrus x bretschneideri]
MSSSSHSHKHTHHISTTTTKTPPTKGNANANTQACAACKYQRRKCASDCILAPYFPHDRQRQFLNAHKLFGVSNIKKIIKHLDQPDKDDAMRTIIFQSDVRANDPVGGCYRIICELQRLIEYNKAELDIVLHQLAICRAQAQEVYQQHKPIQMPEIGDQNACDPSIKVDPWSLYGNPMGHFYYIQQPQPPHHAVALQQEQSQQQQQQRVPYVFVQNNTNSNNNSDSTNGDPHPYPHQHLYEDLSMWAMQDSVSCLDIKQCGGGMNGITNVCEDLKPFVDQIACGDDHERNNGEVIDINGDHQQRLLVTNTELLMSS